MLIEIILTSVLVLIAIIIFILYFYKKRKKVEIKKTLTGCLFYKEQIQKLRILQNNPKIAIEKLERLVRKFFEEIFNIEYERTLSELATELKKRKKHNIIPFCRAVVRAAYSNKKITKEQIAELISYFEKIVENQKKEVEREKIAMEMKQKSGNLFQKFWKSMEKEEKAIAKGLGIKEKGGEISEKVGKIEKKQGKNRKELKKMILQCKNNKKKIKNFAKELQDKKINTQEYNKIINNQLKGRTSGEWIEYYDQKIAEYRKKLKEK